MNDFRTRKRALILAAAALVFAGGAGSAGAQDLSAETIAARQHYFGIDNVDPATGAVRDDRVILSWMGVSNFAASFNGHVVLLNAWIARGWMENALWPNQSYVGSTRDELAALRPELIFFGHGHGDHAGDTPFVVLANPGITVLGAAEHCTDLAEKIPGADYECVSVFEAEAALGTTLPLNDLIPGVEITAVKQPHSNTSTVSETNQPFPWLIGNPNGACQPFADYPQDPNEDETWSAPNSGAITAMWQFRIGEFALIWQDTAGPIEGTGVPEALRALPQTDVRLASIVVAGRSAVNEQLEIIRPKLFIPVHHDPCGWTHRQQFMEQIQTIAEDIRPEVWFMSDPGDYLRPITFDPAAAIWVD